MAHDKCKCEQLLEQKQKYSDYYDLDIDIDEWGAKYVALYMSYNIHSKKFSIKAYGDAEASTEINYCPFCGRKLEDLVKEKLNDSGFRFIHNCYIHKHTPELIEKLKQLGYKYEWQGAGEYDCLHARTGYLYGQKLNDPHVVDETYSEMAKDSDFDGIDCGDNEDLFLAIAAIRDNMYDYQWFVFADGEFRQATPDVNVNDWWHLEYHKATPQELFDYFNRK